MTPDDEQEQFIHKVMRWFKRGDGLFILEGPAGSGKTTIARVIAQRMAEGVIFCAPTGKSALRLKEVGCPNARTIHSLLLPGLPGQAVNCTSYD